MNKTPVHPSLQASFIPLNELPKRIGEVCPQDKLERIIRDLYKQVNRKVAEDAKNNQKAS